jgi:hypothetical protein
MQTIKEIIHSVRYFAPCYSESSFRRDAARLGIRPVTKLRTVPRLYPADSSRLILKSRGYSGYQLPPADTAAARIAKLPSMSELRNERKKARGAK